MRSKELKVYNLPNEDPLVSEIDAKPTGLFVLLVIMGFVSFALQIPVVYSIILIIVGIGCILFMPRVTIMEFYKEYLVTYNKADKNTCRIVYYDEISSWYYIWSANRDTLVIELEDGSIERVRAFSKTIFEKHMNKFLKDKHRKNK